MPGQGPPFFYHDYFQNQRLPGVMDDRLHHPPQGPAIPGHHMPIMAPPYANQYSFRPPLWGPPAFNYHNNNIYHNNNLRNLQPVQRNLSAAQSQPSNEREKTCFICQDALQNSEERGIHLCDGGLKEKDTSKETTSADELNVDIKDMDARLEKLLLELKGCLRNKYESVTETLENYVSSRVGEIETIHQDVLEEKSHLENLQTELKTKTQALEEREKVLREKETQLNKDKEKFEKEVHKEKEEICRQWQQLRDEISRMEKLHEVQKVYRLLISSHPVLGTGWFIKGPP